MAPSKKRTPHPAPVLPQGHIFSDIVADLHRQREASGQEPDIEHTIERVETALKGTINTEMPLPEDEYAILFRDAMQDIFRESANASVATLRQLRADLIYVRKLAENSFLADKQKKALDEYTRTLDAEITKNLEKKMIPHSRLGRLKNVWNTILDQQDFVSLMVGAASGKPLLMLGTKMFLARKQRLRDEAAEQTAAEHGSLDRRIAITDNVGAAHESLLLEDEARRPVRQQPAPSIDPNAPVKSYEHFPAHPVTSPANRKPVEMEAPTEQQSSPSLTVPQSETGLSKEEVADLKRKGYTPELIEKIEAQIKPEPTPAEEDILDVLGRTFDETKALRVEANEQERSLFDALSAQTDLEREMVTHLRSMDGRQAELLDNAKDAALAAEEARRETKTPSQMPLPLATEMRELVELQKQNIIKQGTTNQDSILDNAIEVAGTASLMSRVWGWAGRGAKKLGGGKFGKIGKLGGVARMLGTGAGLRAGVGMAAGAIGGSGAALAAGTGLATYQATKQSGLGEWLNDAAERNKSMAAPYYAARSIIAAMTSDRSATATANIGAFDYDVYREAIGKRESGGNYQAENSYGFLGKYQMGAMALEDAGLLKRGASKLGSNKQVLDNPFNWTIRGGKSAFLNDPDLQERVMKSHTMRNLHSLKRRGVVRDDMAPEEIAGNLGAAHLLGVGGLKKKGLSGTDAYGTTGSEYFKLYANAARRQAPVATAATDTARAQQTRALMAQSRPTNTGQTIIAPSSTTTITNAPQTTFVVPKNVRNGDPTIAGFQTRVR